MSPSPARQPPVITTTRVSYALESAEPKGPAKHTQKQRSRTLVHRGSGPSSRSEPTKAQLTDELLRRQTDGGDPGDGLSALVEVLHKLHEEDPRAAHQAEHEAVAHEQGADQHPAPAPIGALGRSALFGLFGLHGGHDCGGGGHRNTSVTLGCRASSKHETCQTSQT